MDPSVQAPGRTKIAEPLWSEPSKFVGIGANLGHKDLQANWDDAPRPVRDPGSRRPTEKPLTMQSPVRLVLLLFVIAIPLLEIALLIKIGQWLGFWPALLLVVVTAVAGAWLLHRQGLATLERVLEAAQSGKPPVEPVLDGFLVVIAGLLLIMPGVITDSIGLVLLVAPVRKILVRHVLGRLIVVTVGGQGWPPPEDVPEEEANPRWTSPSRRSGSDAHQPPHSRDAEDGIIIEGEFERLDERTVDPKGRKH